MVTMDLNQDILSLQLSLTGGIFIFRNVSSGHYVVNTQFKGYKSNAKIVKMEGDKRCLKKLYLYSFIFVLLI